MCKLSLDTSNFSNKKAICKTCHNLKYRVVRHTPGGSIKEIIKRARRKNIDVSINEEDIKRFLNAPCNYCGGEVDGIRLDRLDSSLGYAKDNIVPCCTKCNYAKHMMSVSEFIEHVEKIYTHQRRKAGGE